MLYGSWPDEQPADQMRTVVVGDSLSAGGNVLARNVKCAGSRKNEVWLTVLRSISNWAPQPLGSFLRTCSWNWQKLVKPLT